MNLTKRRKITALITLSVMLVAVVATACILTVPNLYKGTEDIVPTSTAYGSNTASAYTITGTNTNAAVAYVSDTDVDARIMYPTNIYLDVTESLSDAGYYYFGDFYFRKSGWLTYTYYWWVYDSVFGKYINSFPADSLIASTPNAYTMMSLFGDSYGVDGTVDTNNLASIDHSAQEGPGYYNTSGTKVNTAYKNIYHKVGLKFEDNNNGQVKFRMSGSLQQSVKNAASAKGNDSLPVGATYKFSSPQNMVGLFATFYGTKEKSGDLFAFTGGTKSDGYNSGTAGGVSMSIPGGYTYASQINIDITVYDKSALNTAITNFKSKMLTSANKTLLNRITGSDAAYNAAQDYCTKAETCLKKREVKQSEINEYTTGLNNYVFNLDTFTDRNESSVYNGSVVDISKNWSRYDSQFYNLEINGATSGTEIKNVGTYSLRVSPKTSVTVNGVTMRFRWASSNNNEYKSIGTYTVTPAEFSVTGLQRLSQQFKNSNYAITLASASTTGTLTDNNFSGFVLPNENARSIYLVIDEAGKEPSTIDFTGATDSVSVKDVGEYTVYYKVSASNHKDCLSSFVIDVVPATITLQFDVYNHTYGDTVLTSEEIVDNMLTKSPYIFDATNWEENKKYLNEIFTFNVNTPTGFVDNAGYLIVGDYTIDYNQSGAYADGIGSVNVANTSNRSAYKVNPRPVKVQWTQKTNMYYDGAGNKRPSASIVGDGNFADGTSTALSAVGIVGPGQHPDGSEVSLVGYEAIYAGTYQAYVTCTNPNYIVDTDTNIEEFEILQRPITVVLQDRTREYAQETTASEVWKYYIETLFPANLNNAVYVATTTVSGNALVDSAPSVFEIGLNITDDDYTSQNEAEKYFKENKNGYDLTITLTNKNYVLNGTGAKFYVNPAKIDLDLQAIATKVYNGAEQELVMPNNNTVVTLRGYEAIHRESVQILYSTTENGTYSATPLTMKDFGSMEVWYKVTADNHEENTGHFNAQITKAHIYVNVTKKASGTYGDELPTSEWLIQNLGITWRWTNESNKFDFSDDLQFVLLDATDRRANAGTYSVTYAFKDATTSDNYIIEYETASVNVGVYTINPKTLYINWQQTLENLGEYWTQLDGKDNWSSDGMKYTYDGNTPVVKPVAPDMYNGKENVVVIDADNRDNISLSPISFSSSVKGTYTVKTDLTNPQNTVNYTLANPSETFEIVARKVEIYVQNQTATYGNAYTVPLGRALVSPTSASAMWQYVSADDNTHFIGDHYSSFRLTSDAVRAEGEPLVDAGKHPIIVEPIADATGAITDNYDVVIVTDGAPNGWTAIFEITPVDIHYMGRQFNIDADNDQEQQFVTVEQIRERISTSYGTPINEFKVRMTDLYKNDGTEDVEFSDSLSFVSQTSVPNSVGRYYVWIEITHLNDKGNSNYNALTVKVEVNILTGWISIVISEGISNAQYGEPTHSSQKLVDELTFSAISGIPTDSGLDGDYKDLPSALADLKQFVADGNVTFFVGVGNTTDKMTDNLSYGNYTIYIEVKEGFKYQNFRFLPKNSGDVLTSNINAYTVGKRYIGIEWGVMDEVYGEHGDTSNSHTYELTNLYGTDKVDVTIGYYVQMGDNSWQKVNGHVRDVGTYKAVVESVTHNDYQLPEEPLQAIFQVTPRPVTLELAARELVYGLSDYATRGGVNGFLNRAITGETLYTIASSSQYSSFAYGEAGANIFEFYIGDYTLADGLQYLSAGTYDIWVRSINDNYEIDCVKAGVLTVTKSSDISYDQQQIAPKTYIGEDIPVAPEDVLKHITLAGDNEKLKDQVVVTYKLSSDDDSKYSADYKVKNASVYSVDIKVEAPNHQTIVVTKSFEVERATVTIYMEQATKTYGDTEQELLDADGTGLASFSDWLKKYCKIQIVTTDEAGNPITVTGLDTDFEFKVIQKGQGNGDALEVGKNPVGTYRVYHCNNDELEKNYKIDYYHDPKYENDDEFKCNAEAYKIDQREAEVIWEFSGAIDADAHKFEYSNSAADIRAYIILVGETGKTSVPTTSLSRASYSDKERAIAINVGLYTEKVEVEGSLAIYAELSNYRFTNDTFDFEIVAKKATVTINNQSFVYGAEATKVGEWKNYIDYTCDVEFFGVGQPIELTVVATTDKAYYGVGEYHIVGKNTSANYDVEFKGEGSDKDYAIFEVTSANIEINAVKYPITYDGKTFVANAKDILESENAYTIHGDTPWSEAKITYKQADGSYTDVMPTIEGVTGSNGVKVEFKVQLANHNDQTGEITIEVRPAKVVINISKGATSVYGDDLLSSDKLFEMTKAALDTEKSSINVDITAILTLKVDASGKVNKGLYNIEAQLLQQFNTLYEVELVGAVDAYEVTARQLTVKWNYTDAFEYNGERHTVTATVEGALAGDTVEIGNCQGNSGIDEGNYTAIVSELTNSNYTLGSEATLNWKIAPRAIEVEWVAQEFTYNGESHELAVPTIKEGQLLGLDSCLISVDAQDKTNAGTHTATAETSNHNYVVKNNTFDFVINPAPISVTWNEVALTYNGTEQAPTAIISAGLFGDDKCNIVVTGAQKNAGENYIATATVDNSNYTVVENKTKTFAIAAKAITFTWMEQTKSLTYTGEQQLPTAVAVGTVAGDEVEFEITVGNENDGINVGEYTAVVTGVKANANYVIDSVNQTSMSTSYVIVKGTNEFTALTAPDKTVSELPWSGSDKPQAKWGEVVVKYYTDAACTQEVTDISSAGEGTYWVVVSVAGTNNYDEISETFEVVLEGGLNLVIVIVGAVLSLALLIGAFIVVKSTNKKKKQQGGAI